MVRDRHHPGNLDTAPKVFVGNLPYDVSERELQEHFETVGRVTEVLVSSRARQAQDPAAAAAAPIPSQPPPAGRAGGRPKPLGPP